MLAVDSCNIVETTKNWKKNNSMNKMLIIFRKSDLYPPPPPHDYLLLFAIWFFFQTFIPKCFGMVKGKVYIEPCGPLDEATRSISNQSHPIPGEYFLDFSLQFSECEKSPIYKKNTHINKDHWKAWLLAHIFMWLYPPFSASYMADVDKSNHCSFYYHPLSFLVSFLIL